MIETPLPELTETATLDRRASVRYEFSAAARPAAAVSPNRWPARVRDLSSSGIGLMCERAFDSGRLLTVELQAPRGETVLLHICVVRSVTQPGGGWLVGAAFTEPLEPKQLGQLLGN